MVGGRLGRVQGQRADPLVHATVQAAAARLGVLSRLLRFKGPVDRGERVAGRLREVAVLVRGTSGGIVVAMVLLRLLRLLLLMKVVVVMMVLLLLLLLLHIRDGRQARRSRRGVIRRLVHAVGAIGDVGVRRGACTVAAISLCSEVKPGTTDIRALWGMDQLPESRSAATFTVGLLTGDLSANTGPTIDILVVSVEIGGSVCEDAAADVAFAGGCCGVCPCPCCLRRSSQGRWAEDETVMVAAVRIYRARRVGPASAVSLERESSQREEKGGEEKMSQSVDGRRSTEHRTDRTHGCRRTKSGLGSAGAASVVRRGVRYGICGYCTCMYGVCVCQMP